MNVLKKLNPINGLSFLFGCLGLYHDASDEQNRVLSPKKSFEELHRVQGESLRQEIDEYLRSVGVSGVVLTPVQQSDCYSMKIARGGAAIALHLNLRDVGPQIHTRGLCGDGQLGREMSFLNDVDGRTVLKVALKKFFIERGGPVSPLRPQTYRPVLAV